MTNIKTRLIKWAIILVILTSLITYIVISINKNKTVYVPRSEYDKSSYISVDEFLDPEDEEALYDFEIENERFKFVLDAKTTKFSLYDNKTLETWHSNPKKVSSDYPKELNDLFTIYYERLIEVPKSISVNDMSISLRHYLFKEIDSGLEVLYEVGKDDKLSVFDLPQEVSFDKFQNLILAPVESYVREHPTDRELRTNLLLLKDIYLKVDATQSYLLTGIKADKAIGILYDLIFNISDYTLEDLEEDSLTYGFPLQSDEPYFEFVVRYLLKDEGLEVTIVNDSIFESEKYQISYIDVLPYFGSNNLEDEGITVIPDGSGALINHNSNNYVTSTYEKRIYGSNLSVGSNINIEADSSKIIKMPMYGYVKNGNGFINVLESSDSMASIRAGYKLTKNSTGYTNKIPWIGYRYILRERDSFIFESWQSSQRVYSWTKEYNKEDYKSYYIFTNNGEEATDYFELAMLYQSYLVNKYDLVKTTYNDILHLTILGGYIKKKTFLGIPYDSKQSLTTPKEVLKIIDEIDNHGLPLDISYLGWANDGIKPTVMDKIKYNYNVGNKKEIIKLKNELEKSNNNLYLEFFTQTAYTTKNINKNKDVVKSIYQKLVEFYNYDEASMIANARTIPGYYLNIDKQTDIYKTINKTKFVDNVVLTDALQLFGTDFSNGKLTFRNEIINSGITNLKMLNKSVALRDSIIYGAIYSNKVLDIPLTGLNDYLIDVSIPFLNLVYNGYFNYALESANLDTSKSLTWHKLKAIETGSKMQFTLSYSDTTDLIKTEFNKYFSTYYKNWINDINLISLELMEMHIYDYYITDHKLLKNDGSIVEVTYSNGSKYIINYVTETIIESGE